MKSESQIQSEIMKYLKALDGCFAFKVIIANVGGIPDIIAVYKGYFIGIEVKADKGIWSELQKYFSKQIIRAGGHYILAYSLTQVQEYIENGIKERRSNRYSKS